MAWSGRSARLVLAAALLAAPAACGGDDDAADPAPGDDGLRVVLEDDFSDSGSGFTISRSATGSLAYEDGAYVIETFGADSLKVSDTDLDGEASVSSQAALGDVRIEVDIARGMHDGPVLLGVLCRLSTETPSYYAALYDIDGYWRIAKFAGTTTVLAESDARTEVAGLGEDDSDRVRFECVDGPGGAALGLMLDGEPVAAAVDPAPLEAGRAAMAVGTRGTATHAVATFDDLRITELG